MAEYRTMRVMKPAVYVTRGPRTSGRRNQSDAGPSPKSKSVAMRLDLDAVRPRVGEGAAFGLFEAEPRVLLAAILDQRRADRARKVSAEVGEIAPMVFGVCAVTERFLLWSPHERVLWRPAGSCLATTFRSLTSAAIRINSYIRIIRI